MEKHRNSCASFGSTIIFFFCNHKTVRSNNFPTRSFRNSFFIRCISMFFIAFMITFQSSFIFFCVFEFQINQVIHFTSFWYVFQWLRISAYKPVINHYFKKRCIIASNSDRRWLLIKLGQRNVKTKKIKKSKKTWKKMKKCKKNS